MQPDDNNPVLTTRHPRVARLFYQLLKEVTKTKIQWETFRERYLEKHKVYSVSIPLNQQMKDFIKEWKIGSKPAKVKLRKRCCKKTFLRGAFLITGSVNSPLKSYHFEIVSPNHEISLILQKICKGFEIEAKINNRKNHEVLYIKRADDIARLLNILNAHRSLLKFEEIRAIKETKEEVRRRVNCETANLDKTSKAAVKQLRIIKILNDEGILRKLPKKLQEIADLRLNFPDINFRELGEKTNPPLTKSCINNRFRRLEKIAESYAKSEIPDFNTPKGDN